jgi:tetratricopeptide (TPR) repeat protein
LQNNVAVVLTLLFQVTRFQESDYIHEAIRLLKLATRQEDSDLPNHFLLLTMEETPLRTVSRAISDVPNPIAVYFDSLHYAFFYQFGRSDDPAHLQEASSAQMKAIALTDPENASTLSPRKHRLGTTLIRQVKYFNLVDYVDDAVSNLQTAVSLTPADNPFLPFRLADLVDALLTRFTLKENLEDIEMAVTHQRDALELTPDDAPQVQLATWWDLLGSCHYYRYDRAGNVEDLEESIRSHQKSVEFTEDGDPALLVRLSNLGVPYMSRFEHLGNLDDITEAVKVQERTVNLSSEDDAKLPTRLNNLGLSLIQRYHHTDSEDDLKEAITHQQRSVALTPSNDPELSTRLHNLVISLDFQLDFQSSQADLDAAINMEQRAIELLSKDNPNLPTWLNNLGALFNRRADNGGTLDDLEQAISAHAKAVDVTPADHPDLPIWWSNLGLAYRNKFIHTGDIDALQESIAVLQKSVKMTPPDHADLPGWLNNLCSALDSRFDYTGDREDIEEAIAVSREALRIVPTHRTSLRTTCLHNLGTNLYVHFTRYLIEEDLEESIRYLEEAVTLLPEEHAEFPAPMRALADAQMLRFEHFGTAESLHAAIANLEKVVSIMIEEQVMYRSHLSALGAALADRFELTGNKSDWERAIEVHLKSIALTPDDHPDVTLRYNSLGYSYLARHRRLAQAMDLKEAVGSFRKAATLPSGTWMTRLIAARQWAKYAPDPNEALDAYRASVELVSVAASLRFTIQRRHQHLLETADISRAAAAVALSAGKVEQALEWLEQGRGLVWSQLSQLRAPIEALRAQHPELAERFITVSKGLENAGTQLTSATSTLDERMILQKKTGEQGKHAKEWEELLTTIRAIPEFVHFLRPSPFSDLLSQLPGSGYAVVVNVHPDRCDAMVLSRDFSDGRPLHVPLESFSFKTAEDLYGMLRTNLAEAGVLTRGDALDFEADGGSDANGIGGDGEEDVDEAREESSRGLRVFRKIGSTQGSNTESVLRSLWTLLVEPIVKSLGLTVRMVHLKTISIRLVTEIRRSNPPRRRLESGGAQPGYCHSFPYTLLASIRGRELRR